MVRRLREAKGLSLRDVGQLAELDHAYVHRLETGEKEAPSDDALSRLFRALKPTKRHETLLRFLVGRQVPLEMLDPSIIDDPEITPEDFESAAQMNFRGTAPTTTEDWRRAIDRIRRLREELASG
jgi:transcriptional regulator with XRE-family HTH domain